MSENLLVNMINPKFVLLLCVQYACGFFVKYTPIVQVSEGRLRGVRGLNGQNQYYGIPYGTTHRFQPPTPPAKWNGTFDAVLQWKSCAQAISFVHLGVEDCLTLDVYTPPQAARGQHLPVLIFFHGGGYYYGGKWNYDPEFLVRKNVIVIIANYRMGVLGFLCLNNVANLGLKDQVAALKWIKKNIAAFGGDPDNVTISGQSAGSSSAAMHLLSKQSKGLFHKAILMSGIALAPWAYNFDPLGAALEDATKLRKVKTELDVYNTFLKTPLHDLLAVTHGTSIDFKYFKYSPCYDANYTNSFFHDTPYNTIKSGDFNKVPVIAGFTDLEGLLLYGLNSQRTLEYLDNNFTERLPSIFSWCSDKDKKMIANKIRSHYFGNERINSRVRGGVDLYSDWIAYATVDAFSKLIAKYSDKPVYNYLFTYEGGRNFAKALFYRDIKGASHSDDLFYLFKPAGFTFRVNKMDDLMIDRFTTMLTNFMKFGDPTPSITKLLPLRWPVTTANRSQVMVINQPLTVTDTPAHVRGDFYLGLLCQYGLQGFVPCDSAMQCQLEQ
ncbi:juvenile hormone esterase-like [Anticarsia gemmatalis]|uniref:juvenile hormone esterase-like n=1 Tax=Anticarsia gemmatalis TaxID=129554 RepID=UPI003F7651B6